MSTTKYINTHSTGHGSEDPWDKLSKVFKKYKHTVTYSGGYNPSKYNIRVNGPSGSGFTLNRPNRKVDSVEVFFKGDDNINSKEPLIVGFVYDTRNRTGCNGSKCYYTWVHLTNRSNKVKTGTVGSDGAIKENDLVARLLEEVGPRVQRENKLVINLDEQPTGDGGVPGGRTNYPESGFYKDRGKQVTVSDKQPVTGGVSGFYKYEHTIPGSVARTIEDLYVSYGNNSRFFKTGLGSGYGILSKVTAYYDGGTNTGGGDLTNKLVLFVFTLGGRGAYVYRYSQFVNDFDNVTADNATDSTTVKEIKSGGLETVGHGGGYTDSDLKTMLQEEKERLRPFIEFKQGSNANQHIKITGLQDVDGVQALDTEGYTFKSVRMTANTDDGPAARGVAGGGGSSIGPWTVYSSQLFINDKGTVIDASAKMTEGVLDDITTGNTAYGNSKKYNTITVYYYVKTGGTSGSGNTGDKKALLVEFDQAATGNSIRLSTSSSGGKKYIKRIRTGGTQWAKADPDDIGSDGKVTSKELNKIRIEAGVTTTSGKTTIQPGHASMNAKLIDIKTKETNKYKSVSNIFVDVTEVKHWDPLSKVFKVYRHSVKYPEESPSKKQDYNVIVFPQNYSSSSSGNYEKHIFKYNNPSRKVTEVEVFFKGDATVTTTEPLAVGFIHENDTGDCKYYKWSELKSKISTNAISGYESVSEKDLVTVLLEMIGTSYNRQDKLVIRLGEQPASSSSNYPESGNNMNKITVTKGASGVTGFDKYEHTVSGSVSVDEFYVNYGRNSRFFKTGLGLGGGKIEKVTVYYKTGTDKPLLIVFHFTGGVIGTYEYRYSEFNKELQGLSGGSNWLRDTKVIDKLTSDNAGGRSDSELLGLLQQESGSSNTGGGSSTVATVVGPIAGVGGVGAGVGFAIYKNFAAVSALIGRIF